MVIEMSVEGTKEVTRILTEERELALFLPAITFGYLFVITGAYDYLGASVYAMFAGSISFLIIDLSERDSDKWDELSGSLKERFAILIVQSTVLSIFLSIPLLILNMSIEPGAILTTDLISTILVLGNVGVLSAIIFAIIYE